MKVYVAARYKGHANQTEIEHLCAAVRAAKMQDFSFIRDVEDYKHTFDDPKDLWARAFDEIAACDALLIDVSDHPTGGRLVECGIAYALKKRIFVTVRKGEQYKDLFNGISATVIEYEDYKDLTRQLKKFDQESNFNFRDRTMMFGLLVLFGLVLAGAAYQVFVLLAPIVALGYWLLVRRFVASVRDFDRIVIYIPLTILWAVVGAGLMSVSPILGWSWLILFWFVTLLVLRKLKFSL